MQDVGDDMAVHLDVHVENLPAAAGLGREIVAELADLVVLRSPYPFCLTPHRGERIRPSPVRDPTAGAVWSASCVSTSRLEGFEDELRFRKLIRRPFTPDGLDSGWDEHVHSET